MNVFTIHINKRPIENTKINLEILNAWEDSQSGILSDEEKEIINFPIHKGKLAAFKSWSHESNKHVIQIDELTVKLDDRKYEIYTKFIIFLNNNGWWFQTVK